MKKLGIKLGAVIMSAAFVLAGCGSGKTAQSTDSADKSGKLKVTASFYPMYDFAKKIGGDKVEVKNMISSNVEPHDWEPTPKDLVAVGDSDVFIYNGAGMESWIDKVTKSSDNKKLEVVEASKGVKLLKGEDEDKDAKKAGVEDAHEHGAYDPHVWLAPENVKKEMENIKNAFVKADPKNKDYYENNYKENAKKLDELDGKFKEELKKTKKKDIVVAHQAFGYICNAYGLNQVPIEGLSPDSEPDAAKMAEIAKFAKDNNVKYIFFEDLVSPKVAETIAKEAGAETQVLNPIEGLTDKQLKAGDDYFSIMNKNLEILVKALN